MDTRSDPVDPAASGTDPAAEPATSPSRLLSPLAIMGVVALVGSFACTVAMLIQPAEERGLVLPLATAACGLLGAWLIAWGRPARWVIPSAILLLGLAATAFSLTWVVAAWPAAGCGLGALGAWSYHRRHRALVATVTLLTAGYAVAAAAGLLSSMRGQGHWWIAGQGFGSMLLGGLLLRLGTADREESTVEDDGPSLDRKHARLRIAGRLLIVAGILLPYAGLVLLELADVLVG